MLIGLETFSYAPWFIAGRMDVFGFIRRTHELGLDGVQLNIGVPQDGWGMLGGAAPERLKAIRALCDACGLFIELDTRTYDHETLSEAIRICGALGSDTLRTYVSIPDDLTGAALSDYMKPGGGLARDLRDAVPAIRKLLPLCERHRVRLAIENHEYETAAEIVGVVKALDSKWVGTFIDIGNPMNVWEDPVAAVTTMAPWAVSTHIKDHAVIEMGGDPWIVGVPLGRGSVDLPGCCRVLSEQSSLKRLCIEVVYGYRAPFRKPEADGAGGRLGSGAFRVAPLPHDPSCIAPYPNYQNAAELPPAEGEAFLRWCDQAVEESVAYVKNLNRRLRS